MCTTRVFAGREDEEDGVNASLHGVRSGQSSGAWQTDDHLGRELGEAARGTVSVALLPGRSAGCRSTQHQGKRHRLQTSFIYSLSLRWCYSTRDVHETFWVETETRRCSFRDACRDLEAPETLFNVSPRRFSWRMVKHIDNERKVYGLINGATEKRETGKPGTKSRGWKTRDRKTRHQIAGVENEGINCMDSQWDNFCNLLK